jgi:hypothetical protein
MPKQPRQRCGFCQGIGHNRLTCPKRALQIAKKVNGTAAHVHVKSAAEPGTAIHSIVPDYALWLVSEGRTGQALAHAKQEPGMVGDTMLQALAELDVKAKKVPAEQITAMKDAERKLAEAQLQADATRRVVIEKLGYKG